MITIIIYMLFWISNFTWNFILLIQPINNSNKCCTLYFVFSDMNYEEVGITMKYIWYYEKMIWSTVFMFVISNTSTKDNSQNIVHYEKLFESALTNSYFSFPTKQKKLERAINSSFSSNIFVLLVLFITIYSCIQENWQSSMWYGESNTFLLSCSYIVEMLYLWYIIWFIIKNAGQITTQVSCEWKLFEMCMIRWYIAFGSYYVIFDWPVTFVYKTKIKDYYYFVRFFFL